MVKKKLFSKFSFFVKDTKKIIKHHLFVYKRSMLDQKFEVSGTKIRAATLFASSKLKWAWRAQFLSYDLQTLNYSHRHFCFDKLILCTKWPNFTTPFYYVKVPKSKNELTHVHVGQKRPFTQKIRSLAQKRAILVF